MSRRALRASLTRPVDGGVATLLPEPEAAEGWLLLLDGTQQSHVDLADPTHLSFEYMRRIGHVIDILPPGPIRVLHLGGGAMTLARYVCATRPRSRNLVVEIDASLTALVREHLPWPREYSIRVRQADAREALDALPDASADLIVLDVFASARTPGNLTSVEAFDQARRVLGPGGTLAANIADAAPLDYARSFLAGVLQVFGQVAVMCEPSVLRGRRFGNLVVVGRPRGAVPLDVTWLARRTASDPWPARVLHGPALADFVAGHLPFVDATAPGSPEPPGGGLG
ncbi:MAG: fused MFS/spermidine synthase [Candidatus Nanopelagicales bacterium]